MPVRLSIWSFGDESDQPNGTIIEEELTHNTNPLSDGLIIPFGESTKIGNALFHLFPGLTAVSVLDLAQAENGDITGLNIYGELHAAALLGPNDDDTSHPFRNLDGSLQSLNGLSILPDPNAEANEETDGRSAHVILENANRSLLDLLTDKLEGENAVQSNLELYEQTLEQNLIANTLFFADFIERGHLDGAELILTEDEGSETSVTIVKAKLMAIKPACNWTPRSRSTKVEPSRTLTSTRVRSTGASCSGNNVLMCEPFLTSPASIRTTVLSYLSVLLTVC